MTKQIINCLCYITTKRIKKKTMDNTYFIKNNNNKYVINLKLFLFKKKKKFLCPLFFKNIQIFSMLVTQLLSFTHIYNIYKHIHKYT